jgi:hypothetical protein
MGAVYLLLMLAGWVAWVRLAWRLPWGAVLLPSLYRRRRREALAEWARESGFCLRHRSYAGGCIDTALLPDPATGEDIPMRWVELRFSPYSRGPGYGGRWESFDGTLVQPPVRCGVPFIESPRP